MEGVRSISVSLERKEGVAEFYPDAVSAAALSEKIFEMGFDTELKTATAAATSSSSASRQVLVKCLLLTQGTTKFSRFLTTHPTKFTQPPFLWLETG